MPSSRWSGPQEEHPQEGNAQFLLRRLSRKKTESFCSHEKIQRQNDFGALCDLCGFMVEDFYSVVLPEQIGIPKILNREIPTYKTIHPFSRQIWNRWPLLSTRRGLDCRGNFYVLVDPTDHIENNVPAELSIEVAILEMKSFLMLLSKLLMMLNKLTILMNFLTIADVLELTGGESHVEIFVDDESRSAAVEAAIVKAVPVVENTPVWRVHLMQFRPSRYNALNAKAALNGRTLFGLTLFPGRNEIYNPVPFVFRYYKTCLPREEPRLAS
ncbi:hypothetical protein DAPPUDRAFT_107410 [Daphnia pulex]|uniref:Uncharacterized protein n=1 Tax=Daphnia pulex TaxID=6669 RepID=E9GX05_DAPPU|nr:hypothetical protein DAPPUDRAFT_107410 [Daphnia pulex]|eukprot:EFX75987.1 hypothetical protein DAPPUDRAFT_107410 [Daphnia pulex]